MVVFAAAISLVLGTTISVPQIFGGLLVIGGVLLTSVRSSGNSHDVMAKEQEKGLRRMGGR